MAKKSRRKSPPKESAAGDRSVGNEPNQAQIDHLLAPYRQADAATTVTRAREFTRVWPRHPAGWQVLSESAAVLGHLAEAIEAARAWVRLSPEQAEAHASLGFYLARARHYRDAEKAYQNALSIAPSLHAVQFNLAKLYESMGKPESSVPLYRRLLDQFPGWIEAKTNYGNVLRQVGRTKEAVSVLTEADRSRPKEPIIKNNLAKALFENGDLAGAERLVREVLQIDPKNAQSLDQLGHVLSAEGKLQEAAQAWREGARLYPQYAVFHHNLGNLWYQYGHEREAEEAYRAALANSPDNTEFRRHLAQAKRFEHYDSDLAEIEQRLADPSGMTAQGMANLHYAAGKAHRDIGSSAEICWDHFLRGASWKRSAIEYDVAADERFFERIKEAFPDPVARPEKSDVPDITPIFIVGMPRSGTTLIEEILGGHSKVATMGESPILSECIREGADEEGKTMEQWIVSANPESLKSMAHHYCERVKQKAGGKRFVTDKMMLNFRFVGPIVSYIPNARIVHVRREPADTCLSCFAKMFSGALDFTYDLDELGRYYRAYAGLMEHWRGAVAGDRMIEIDYEEVVRAPESRVGSVLRFCALDWEDGVMQIGGSGRAVDTASALQVRKPLSEASIGTWRGFAPQLERLFKALGPLAPTDG